MDRRFTPTNLDLMKALQACHPLSSNFLEPSILSHMASLYKLKLNNDIFSVECTLAKRTVEDKNITSVIDLYHHILPRQAAFPTLSKLLQIGLTLAVSTAHCERSVSALK